MHSSRIFISMSIIQIILLRQSLELPVRESGIAFITCHPVNRSVGVYIKMWKSFLLSRFIVYYNFHFLVRRKEVYPLSSIANSLQAGSVSHLDWCEGGG